MKVSVLYAGLSTPHAGWVAIDELAELLSLYLDAEVLSPKVLPNSWVQRQIRPHQVNYEPLNTTGGDVLIVVARGPGDLGMVNAIANCRQKFGKIYGFVTDSYFQAGFVRETALFDAITVTAHEDMAFPQTRFHIPVHQMYQGADCLTWVPRAQHHRDIDVMGFGRTPPSYQTGFSQRFHPASSPHLYLHSPLGNLSGPSVHLERGMLFKLLQRTRISLAFHLYVEPQGGRPRSMMVTSRWLESLNRSPVGVQTMNTPLPHIDVSVVVIGRNEGQRLEHCLGTPTARQLSGTSVNTTALAPISTLLPMRILPSTLAPAPMSTLSPNCGAHGSSTRLKPITTPVRMRQLSPNLAKPLTTMPPLCSMTKFLPIGTSHGSSIPVLICTSLYRMRYSSENTLRNSAGRTP